MQGIEIGIARHAVGVAIEGHGIETAAVELDCVRRCDVTERRQRDPARERQQQAAIAGRDGIDVDASTAGLPAGSPAVLASKASAQLA